MALLKLAALCCLCLLPAALLKRSAPEQALLLTLAALTAAAGLCLEALAPALEELGGLLDRAGVDGGHAAILFKIAAAATVTKLCADLCRDGGSQALASAVELAGTAAGLVLSLPLVRAVAELLLGFFA